MTEDQIIIDRLPPRSGLLFGSPSDVLAFLDREMSFWTWVQGEPPTTNNGHVTQLFSRYDPSWVNQARGHAENWRAGDVNARNQLASDLRQRFTDQRFLTALDPEALAIEALAQTDKNVAAVALAVIHGVTPFADKSFASYGNNAIGIAKGFAILAGIDPTIATGATTALSVARADFEKDANQLRSAVNEVKQSALSQAENISTDAKSQAQQLEANYSKAESERDQAFGKLKADLEGLTAAYEHHMQLQGPVRYWQKKAQRHHRAKWTVGMILIAYCVVAIFYLQWAFEQAAAHLPSGTVDQVPVIALFKAGAFALLISSIAFWIGRVLLRIFLSNQHLATDADERMTMVMTFLALIRKKAIEDKDRQLILTPLFRAGSDGIVKDDSSPDTAMATFLSGLAKK